jgi:protocatechuate 3,4-dioxygenase beta subunit
MPGIPAILPFVVAGAFAATTEVRVGGRVLGPGKAPMAKADVRLLPEIGRVARARLAMDGRSIEPAARARADDQGYFSLAAPHPGLWTVRVEASGFVPVEMKLEPLIEPRELDEVTLEPDRGIEITVKEAGGAPLPGAMARLVEEKPASTSWWRPQGWRTAPREGITGAGGKVRFPIGAKERLALAVATPAHALLERQNVRGGAVTLALARGIPRAVEVVSADRKPAGGALLAAGDHELPLGFSDARGRIVIPLAPGGPLEVLIVAEDGRSLAGRVEPAAATEGDAPRQFVLPNLGSLAGLVIDRLTRQPVTDALVWPDGEPWNAVRTGSAGTFAIAAQAGKKLSLAAGASGYLRSRGMGAFSPGDGSPGPTLPLRPAAVIEGVVVDGGGAPIAGARVGMALSGSYVGYFEPQSTARTDRQGRFRLSPVDPENDHDVAAAAAGFAPARETIRALEPRKTRSGVRIVLSAGQSVTGAVLNPGGQALKGATISIASAPRGTSWFRMRDPRLPAWTDPVQGSSDEQGRFTIPHVPSGSYDLTILLPGFAKLTSQGHEVPRDAETIDLGSFTMVPGERLQGQVVDSAGRPIDGVEVRVVSDVAAATWNRPDRSEPDATTGPDGWFALDDLGPGSRVDLWFRRTAYVERREPAVDVPHPGPLTVTIQAASRVSGTVVDADGDPVAGAAVSFMRTQRGGDARGWFRGMTARTESADGDGRFLFEGIEPGPVSLSAVAEGFRKTELGAIDVPEGKDLTDVVLRLEPGAVLLGRVTTPDEQPCINAHVRVVLESSDPLGGRGGVDTDGAGRYRLEGLAPGRLSIEANHLDFLREVKEIEVRPGINHLDLKLGGGQTVSGRVTDVSGSPITDAWVSITTSGWGGSQAMSELDGSFTLKAVRDGEYQLSVRADGYSPLRNPTPVKVAGKPVTGIDVRLDPAGTIAGRIIGVEPSDYPFVEVSAGAPGAGSGWSGVDHQGNYRIGGLGAGKFRVGATVGRSGKQASGTVEIKPGVAETRLDLEFGKGLVLGGRAILEDRPIKGAMVMAYTDVGRAGGQSRTDGEGAFRIEGLISGRYKVSLRQWETGLAHDVEVDLDADRELEIHVPTTRLAGLVVDAATLKPLAGVDIALAPPTLQGEWAAFLQVRSTATGADGRFRIQSVADGSWTLRLSKPGYAARSVDLEVRGGRDRDDLKWELDPTQGLTLNVRLPTGDAPDQVRVAVFGPDGRTVLQRAFDTGEDGAVRLTSLAAGTWQVTLAATGAGTTTIEVASPGESVRVGLLPACGLRVDVPGLAAGADGNLTLTDERGRPFRALGFFANPIVKWSIGQNGWENQTLPPGTWTVRVNAADGKSWQGTATTTPGEPVRVVLK